MTPETIAPEDHRSSAQIESNIRERRGRMDATLEELGNRLSARSILNTAMDWWEAPQSGSQGNVAARSAVKAVARQIKHHPMPSLLIGSGLAWLVAESMDHDGDREVAGYDAEVKLQRYGLEPVTTMKGASSMEEPGLMDKAKDRAADAREAVEGAMGSARSKLSHAGEEIHHGAERIQQRARGTYDRSRTAASKLKHDLKDGYHRGAGKFEEAVDEYPLAVGVAFAALGALAGLVIPRTRREDDLLGERSDRMLDSAKEKGSELLESGKAIGERVMETAKEEAARQGLTGDAIGEKIAEIADKSGEVVQKARQEAVHAAEEEGILPEHSNDEGGASARPEIR